MGERSSEWTSVLRALGRLVLPQECAGCGRPDRVLCRRCARGLGDPVRCEHLTQHLLDTLPTWALGAYAGGLRHAILAWKSGGRPDLAEPLTAAIERAAAALPIGEASMAPDRLLVVPAPSGAARRRAGRFVVGDLADALGRGVAAATSADVAVVDVLRRRGGNNHLLGAAARSRERAHAVRCLTRLPQGAPCVLVDDVVTTGATLAAAAGAIREAGGRVLGAVVLAVTAPPGSGSITVANEADETQRTLRFVD